MMHTLDDAAPPPPAVVALTSATAGWHRGLPAVARCGGRCDVAAVAYASYRRGWPQTKDGYELTLRVRTATAPRDCSPHWFQIAKSCHKISSINVISRVFSSKFHQIDMYFRFPRMSFTLKSGKIVAGISTVRQFHEFFKSNFRRVFVLWPNCTVAQKKNLLK